MIRYDDNTMTSFTIPKQNCSDLKIYIFAIQKKIFFVFTVRKKYVFCDDTIENSADGSDDTPYIVAILNNIYIYTDHIK